MLALVASGCGALQAADLSDEVLRKAESYPNGGGYEKEWKGSGTAKEIKHRGGVVLPRGTGGTYCSGFTFTVVMDVLSERKLIATKTAGEIRQFQKTWYGANRNDGVGKEQQCLKALTDLGLGKPVALEAARPGNFIQFWREASGHSVILVSVVRESGKIVGFTYRSSQGGNGQDVEPGIGTKTERFQEAGGKINPARVYIVSLADG